MVDLTSDASHWDYHTDDCEATKARIDGMQNWPSACNCKGRQGSSNSMVDDLRRHAGYVERQFPQTAWTLRNIADELQRCAPETCDALTEAHCYEGEKDYQIDQLLDYLHYDPDTRSHPDWVARAQAAEAELAALKANTLKAEVCGRCRGSGRVPSPGGVEGEYCACGRCGGSGHAKSEGDQR